MRRFPLPRYSFRDLVAVGLPILALIVGAFWLAATFVKPAPPRHFVISTGAVTGAYHAFAEQYAKIIARHGITLELRASSGSVENLERLRDPGSGADAGFVQSGITWPAGSEDDDTVRSLGSTHLEPVWVFYRSAQPLDRLTDLRGKRIAIGPEGSGARKLALDLLAANGIDAAPTRLLPIAPEAAAEPLLRGEIDALIHVASPRAGIVAALLHAEGVRLMSFSRGPAYARLFPFISEITLPQSSISLVRDLPPRDTQLIATTAQVMVRSDLHPALQDLLLQAMREVHSAPGPLSKAKTFPKPDTPDFTPSDAAERFYRSGPPLLQRYLPFWAANFVDRMIVLLIPLFGVLLPLLRIAPPLYTWRVRAKISRWYGELKFLEHEIRERFDAAKLAGYADRLDDLEAKAYSRPIPLAFTDQVYTLRMHIRLVRELIATRAAALTPASS